MPSRERFCSPRGLRGFGASSGCTADDRRDLTTMADLFEDSAREHFRRHAPLAERMRPRSFEEFFGQEVRDLRVDGVV